jgi:hypothetical protein
MALLPFTLASCNCREDKSYYMQVCPLSHMSFREQWLIYIFYIYIVIASNHLGRRVQCPAQ